MGKYNSVIKLLYRLVPVVFVLGYIMALAALLIDNAWSMLIRCIVVPFMVFVLTSVFRKVINCKRPYEVYDITPLVAKDKKGQSFPSRHSVSAAVISLVCLRVNVYAGIFMIILTIVQCYVRVYCRVHFVKDVVCGAVLGFLGGILLFL